MKLCYGTSSAFSRKVRIAAIECGLSDRITLVLSSTLNHDPELAAVNPLAKVPALVTDDGETLFDSPVICEYLDTLHQGRRLIPPAGREHWRVLCRQALGDGLMEALVFLGMPVRRPDGVATSAAVMERERARVERGLDVLEAQTEDMVREGVTVGSIAVGCALGWLESRFPDWDWRTKRPSLAAWYEAFSRRPSMVETVPFRSSEKA
jgi:glutathione S-transferase